MFEAIRDDHGTLLGQRFVLFDGACGFCTWSVVQAMRIDRLSAYTYVPYQYLEPRDFDRFKTSLTACAHAVHVIDRKGRRHRGAFAVNSFLATFPQWWPVVAMIYMNPVLLLTEIAGYAFVARFRVPISAMLGTRRFAAIHN